MSGGYFRRIGVLALAGAVSACSLITDREAGYVLDEGNFGNPTMNNELVQTGRQSARISLARRFAAEVDSTINFPFNSSRLDAASRATLRRQASWIQQFPEVKFRVYGHTDLVGSAAYNKRLGLRRAQAALNYLVAQGVSRSRLQALASYGETRPLVATSEPERRNRRTVTEVSGFVGSHPMVLNGKYAEVIFREYVKSAKPAQGSAAAQAAPAAP
ncbi:OmpA family protein [Brevirhabdus sp.]|uniref:OmpA family protein n=1 Tax=Brevirhabdus sp. TaxID=2004514 RepID=UPI00405963A0